MEFNGHAFASNGLLDRVAALCSEAVCLAIVEITVFAVCLASAKANMPGHQDIWSLADTFASLMLYPLLACLALRGAWELSGDVETRWHGVCESSRLMMLVYVTRGTLHCIVLCFQQMSFRDLILMLVHHALSNVSFGGALVTGRMHYFACLDACCEVTNIFLNNVYLGKSVEIKGCKLKDYAPRLYIVNGVSLWLTYLGLRLALFPYWLYAWRADIESSRALTWDRVSNFERVFYPAVNVFLLVVSTIWFAPITRGLWKAVGGRTRAANVGDSKLE